jgi:myo-inositol-1(or 4)-monophosphatase
MKKKGLFLLKSTEKVAKEAASFILAEAGGVKKVSKELRRDVKIVADRKLEKYIIDKVTGYSGYPILSEECGFLGKHQPGSYYWIIDPLDGSLNFSRGLPLCCISISLWQGMAPVLGVIYDFNRNEMFSGSIGGGAHLNGLPINVSTIKKKSKAILCTGFPAGSNFSVTSLNRFVNDIKTYKKVRLLGSAALSLAYVACGKVDAYYEKGIKLWDVAAGLCLVQAAGGKFSLKILENKDAYAVKADNGKLFKK